MVASAAPTLNITTADQLFKKKDFIVRNSKPLKGVADMKNYFIIYNQNIQG